MNKVILMGRLTRDPDVRRTAGENSIAVARYTLAVDRRMRRDNNDPNAVTADFPGCVCFGKAAEFAEQYLHKGTKVVVEGRLQTGKYTDKDGNTVYTTDVVLDSQEFAESKAAAERASAEAAQQAAGKGPQQTEPQPDQDSGFMPADQEKLPWE